MTRAFIIQVELDDGVPVEELTLIAEDLAVACEDAGFQVSSAKPWASPLDGDAALGAAFGGLPL